MDRGHFTVLPFLLSLMVALIRMPGNVVQVCARELGTERFDPWRLGSTFNQAVQQASRAFRAWWRRLFPVAAFAMLLMALLLAPHPGETAPHVVFAAVVAGPASVTPGRTFFNGSQGRWAGEQMRRALAEGRPLTPNALRVCIDDGPEHLRANAVLRRDEWIQYDAAIVESAAVPLRGVADLIARGLTRTIPNGMAKTVLKYDLLGDMEEATVSMDGVTRSELDRIEFTAAALPMPITHKDFNLDLRTLSASRLGSEPLDTLQARVAGRKVGEATEDMLFNGGKTFAGLPIYGYLNHPDRNQVNFGTGGSWAQSAKTGAQILADALTMVAAATLDRKTGPYAIYYSTDSVAKMSDDFKATGDLSITQRLLQIPQIAVVQAVESLPDDTAMLVQLTPDVVELIEGEPLQTVQWDLVGIFLTAFKAFQIQIPLVRSDGEISERAGNTTNLKRSGIVVMTEA